MNIFLLWFSIFSFSLLSIAFVISLSRWIHFREYQEKVYLLLITVSLLWLVMFSYLFFTAIYLIPLSFNLQKIFGSVRMIISSIILFLYPALILTVWKKKISTRHILVLTVLLLILSILALFFLERITPFQSSLISMTFYLYLSCFAIFAVFLIHNHKTGAIPQRLKFYFYLTSAVYPIFFILSIPSIITNSNLVIHVLPRAVFSSIWGAGEIFLYIRRGYKTEKMAGLSVNPDFIRKFKITEREKDVILLLMNGESIRQMAEHLYISNKTIESHLYSIYRKCKVNSKVQLINLERNFSLR